VDPGETPEQAAVREMEEETGLHVIVQRKLAEIHFGLSEQVYYLVDRLDGEFGTGTGEEFTDSDPNDPAEGVYIPIWMPVEELPRHENVYPLDVAALVAVAASAGWPEEPIVVVEFSN
jgi:8-oxo-dGTP pyrophosphatase MutT (NUDIX family)